MSFIIPGNITPATIAISVITIGVAAYIMGLFRRKNHFDVAGKVLSPLLSPPISCKSSSNDPQTILLTGASSGMGLSVAKQLSAKGANIAIVARNVGKLEEALAAIKSSACSPKQTFQHFSADLTAASEAARIVAEVTTWNHGAAPDIVWCMAGASDPKLFLDASRETLRSQMDVNYWACADMAHAILKEWLSPSSARSPNVRHLIFTSSTLAFYPIVGYSPYSPCKAAMRSLCDTLSQEILLYSDTVKIHTVFPGSIDTPGFAQENIGKPDITKKLEEPDPVQTPDEVAKAAIAGLEGGQYLITVNFIGAAMRASAWGVSLRNNWVVDTLFSFIVSVVVFFIQWDMNGQVRKYGQTHGHPSTYVKQSA